MEKTFYHHSFAIRYHDVGKGIPVLLLHGFGEDCEIFEKQVDFLQPYCRLVLPDLPGSGASQPIGPDYNIQIQEGLPRSIPGMADAMAALMESIGIGRYLTLGHSMGGYITLAMAEKYSDRLTGFGLVHSTAFADTDEKKATRRKGIDFIRKHGGFAFLQTAIPGLFTETFKENEPGQVVALIEHFDPQKTGSSTLDASLIAYYEAMIERPDRTDVLRCSSVPVLFVIGTEDKAAPMNDVLQQVPLPVQSHIHIIENVAHMSMMEAPEQLNQHLLSYINAVGDQL